MAILSPDGKSTMSAEVIEVNGFSFNVAALQNNPIELIMGLISIDPTPLQEEMMNKVGLVLKDINGNQIFPREEEEEIED